ncbi:MAG: FMN-binding negative transcriptional regulator [Pseudomonadota bacterium]
MHPNPAFHTAEAAENRAFARDRGFGILAVGEDGAAPLLSHVPFLLSDDGTQVDLHLVRSNPIARALRSGPRPARIAVSGPDSYVSPDWYGLDDQVPTWNYIAVHITGALSLLPDDQLHDMLTRQSSAYEERLAPKPPWTLDKMTPEALEKLKRMILPARLQISQVNGTWKLNQNKPEDARLSAADHMDAYGFGTDPQLLAALMRGA